MNTEKIQEILHEVTGRSKAILPPPVLKGEWATWSKFDLNVSHKMASTMVEQLIGCGFSATYENNRLSVKVDHKPANFEELQARALKLGWLLTYDAQKGMRLYKPVDGDRPYTPKEVHDFMTRVERRDE